MKQSNSQTIKRSRTAAMRRGQALTEYLIVFAALLVAVFAVIYLIRETKKGCRRAITLVASDFP